MQKIFAVLKSFAQKKARDARKCQAVLALFTDLAAHPDAQNHFLQASALSGLMDVVYDLAEMGNRALTNDAMFFLRNLAFLPENKPHFVANERTLALLLSAVDGNFSNVRAAACAASAMWALLYNGQKVKATFKKTGNIELRLANARNMLEAVAGGALQDSGKSDALAAVRCLDAVLELLKSEAAPRKASSAVPAGTALAAPGVVH